VREVRKLLKDNAHELAMLLGLIVDWGGTGATGAGIGTSFSVLTPTYYFGQGFGELPDTLGWARPIALTGQIGYIGSAARDGLGPDPRRALGPAAPQIGNSPGFLPAAFK
jgi:hypothetical protein